MPNRFSMRVLNRIAPVALVLVFSACSKEKREDSAAPPSAQAPLTSASAAAPAASSRTINVDVTTAKAVEKSCNDVCERSRSLKCKNAGDCVKSCLAMGIGTPCSDAFTALYACLGRQPAEHWECDDDGTAAIKEGFCEKEQERTVACIEAKAQP